MRTTDIELQTLRSLLQITARDILTGKWCITGRDEMDARVLSLTSRSPSTTPTIARRVKLAKGSGKIDEFARTPTVKQCNGDELPNASLRPATT